MRIAIAQINSTLGDVQTNQKKILEFIEKSRQKKAQIVVFPEMALLGYHPFDLLERSEVADELEKSQKEIHKRLPKGMAVLLGTLTRNKYKKGRPYFNSAVLLERGRKAKVFNKQILPTGDVFDEGRFIESGEMKNNYFTFQGKKFFLTICEDVWSWPDKNGRSSYKSNPLALVPKKQVDLVINMSASPWFVGKEGLRHKTVKKTAQYFNAPLLYTNMVGAQDEIIYDGGSFVMAKTGKILLTCHRFTEDLNVFDIETHESWARAPKVSGMEELRQALVTGIRDYCHKTGLRKIHFGLSGGIDSAVVAALAVDALGPANVVAFAMPGPHSLDISYKLAQELAKNLAIELKQIDINPTYSLAEKALSESLGVKEFGIVHENLQARLRGLFLMAYSNITNSLLLTTGNKSEYATGYCTLYGDMCGGLAPLGDLIKKQVYQLAEYYNTGNELIPKSIITRPPSAELRPNQKDQDSLPPYEVLDQAVVNIVQKGRRPKNDIEKWLVQRIVNTEFKRWQAAPILKTSSHAFGRGRRWPLAHRALRSK